MTHLLPAIALGLSLLACARGEPAPQHREASPERDRECRDASMPRAYFYPAENRTDYRPDDPYRDGCAMLVPDHIFCCPAPRAP